VRASVVAKLASGKRGDVPYRAEAAGLRLDRLGRKETDQSNLEFLSKLFTLERYRDGASGGGGARGAPDRAGRFTVRHLRRIDNDWHLRQQARIQRQWSNENTFFATQVPEAQLRPT
jgi:hypothetical protein